MKKITHIGTVIEGKYEIQKEIGRGGMSIVYLAMDRRLHKPWAVKEIRKKGSDKKNEIIINSLWTEANLMKRFDHPYLPRIVDIIENDKTLYIVMDYIEGESLDKIIKAYGPQPEEMVIEWGKQLCEGLSYLHAQEPPIIYHDMKPGNIMLKPEGNIKIIDFGIAREYKIKNQEETTVLGTKGYAPPEQYSGQTDIRSDIFSLGMTMYHLVTGIDPRGGTPYAPVRQWNPALSEGIEWIIDKCVQPAAENRYQTCKEVLYDLEHPEWMTKTFQKKQRRKSRELFLSLGLGVVALVVGIVCNAAVIKMNNQAYDAKISLVESTSIEEKMDSYKQAIAIYPYDARAYIKMLEAYELEGQFGKQESEEFLAFYNANKDGFDASSVEIAELNYKVGMMYFNYYGNADENCSFSYRVQMAYPFFEANYKNAEVSADFTKKNLSDCYYQICSFYKKYILSSSMVEEVSKENYKLLLKTIWAALEDVKEAGAYDQLSLYNGTFMLLYDQRADMCSVKVEQSEIMELFDKVYNRAKSLSVQKEQSQQQQQEMIDNYQRYREAIERTYKNAEER